MLLRGVYLLAGFVSQGVLFVVYYVIRGADLSAGFVAVRVDQTAELVVRSVNRTGGLATEAWGSAVRLWEVAGVEPVNVAVGLFDRSRAAVGAYFSRLEATSHVRASYRRFTRPLGARYRALRKSRQ
jgi:hypothetical protein